MPDDSYLSTFEHSPIASQALWYARMNDKDLSQLDEDECERLFAGLDQEMFCDDATLKYRLKLFHQR